ncbi:MAG: hypothetical protein ACLPKB_02620 [Xanthobacteraceae bacterium]
MDEQVRNVIAQQPSAANERTEMPLPVAARFSRLMSAIGLVAKFALLIAFAAACQLAHVIRLAHLGDQYYLVVSHYHWLQLSAFAIAQSLPALILTGIVPMVVWAAFGSRRTTFNLAMLGWAVLYLGVVAFSELAFMSQQSVRGGWPL